MGVFTISKYLSYALCAAGLSRQVGGGGKVSQVGQGGVQGGAPLAQPLTPHLPLASLERTEAASHSLTVLDFSRMTKQPPATGAMVGHRKKRKKALAVPRGMTKEEYFSRLEHF